MLSAGEEAVCGEVLAEPRALRQGGKPVQYEMGDKLMCNLEVKGNQP